MMILESMVIPTEFLTTDPYSSDWWRKYNESCCGNTGRNSQNFLNNRTWPNSAPMLVSEEHWQGQLILHCKTMCCFRMTSPSTSTTSGTLTTCTPSSRADWVLEEKVSRGDRQSVFFRAVNPMYANQDPEGVQYDLDKPDLRCTKILGESTKIQYIGAIWSSLKEKDCSSIKTRSHAITFFSNTLLANCIEKVVCMRLKRIYTAKYTNPSGFRASYSRRICNLDVRIHPIPKREIRRPSKRTKREVRETCRSVLEDPRRKHPEESQRGKYRETCHGNVDYRIPGIPHSTVQKWRLESQGNRQKTDSTSSRNHPNRRLVSEKSKELITSMGNTEYFELCETSSEIQCLDCDLFWEAGIIHCTCGKCMQPTERNRQLNKGKIRHPVNSRQCHQKKKTHSRCQTLAICAASHVPQSTWYAEESP